MFNSTLDAIDGFSEFKNELQQYLESTLAEATPSTSGLMSAVMAMKLSRIPLTSIDKILDITSVDAETDDLKIAAAINVTQAENSTFRTINIPEGLELTLSSAITLPRNINLQGGGSIKFTSGNLKLSGENTIFDITIDGNERSNGLSGISLLDGANDVTISDCRIVKVSKNGINLNGGTSGSRIYNNIIDGIGEPIGLNRTYEGCGIYASGAANQIDGLVIENNLISDVQSSGIMLHCVQSAMTATNTISKTYFRGIIYTGTTYSRPTGFILRNKISETGYNNDTASHVGCNGIFVNYTDTAFDVIAIDNIVDKVGENGIEGRLTVIGGSVSSTGHYGKTSPSKEGVFLTGEGRCWNVQISKTASHGISVYSSTSEAGLRVIGNDISEATGHGIQVIADTCVLSNGVISNNIIDGGNDDTKYGILATVANGGEFSSMIVSQSNTVFGRNNSLHSTISTGISEDPVASFSSTASGSQIQIGNSDPTPVPTASSKTAGVVTADVYNAVIRTQSISSIKIPLISSVAPTITTSTTGPSTIYRVNPSDSASISIMGRGITQTTGSLINYSWIDGGLIGHVKFRSPSLVIYIGMTPTNSRGCSVRAVVNGVSADAAQSISMPTIGTLYWTTVDCTSLITSTERRTPYEIDLIFQNPGDILTIATADQFGAMFSTTKPNNKVAVLVPNLASMGLSHPLTCLPLLTGGDYMFIPADTGTGLTGGWLAGSTPYGVEYGGSTAVSRVTTFNPSTIIFSGSNYGNQTDASYDTKVKKIINDYKSVVPNANIVILNNFDVGSANFAYERDLSLMLSQVASETSTSFIDVNGTFNWSTEIQPWGMNTTYGLNSIVTHNGLIWKCVMSGAILGVSRAPGTGTQWVALGVVPSNVYGGSTVGFNRAISGACRLAQSVNALGYLI